MLRLSDTESHTTPPTAVSGGVMDGVALPVCTIAVRRYRRWSAVMLRGELDRPSAEEVALVVDAELEQGRSVTLELVGLEGCDTDALFALADLARRSEPCPGSERMEVRGARGEVARLIRQVGLGDLLTSG